MNRAKELVESATHISGALRVPMCYVMDKPRAHVFYAVGSPTYLEQEARTDASIQAYYNEYRAKGSPCFVGD